MHLTLLCENTISEKAGDNVAAEWGFSAFIEVGGVRVLFDFGGTSVWVKNAKVLRVDLERADFLALSHHHSDHVGGLRYYAFKSKKKFITHPDVLQKISKGSARKLNRDFEVILSKDPLEFAPNCFYLGQIPRITSFESGTYEGDNMYDDSALAFKTPKGIIIVTGCSHSGICNICEYAKKILGQNLYAVIGGFHLFEDNLPAFEETMKYLEKENIEILLPMHCVAFPLLAKMQQKFGFNKYSSGDVIHIEEV